MSNAQRPEAASRARDTARSLRVVLVVEAAIDARPVREPFPGIELSDEIPAAAV